MDDDWGNDVGQAALAEAKKANETARRHALLVRLQEGDDLHRRAAAEIERLQWRLDEIESAAEDRRFD